MGRVVDKNQITPLRPRLVMILTKIVNFLTIQVDDCQEINVSIVQCPLIINNHKHWQDVCGIG